MSLDSPVFDGPNWLKGAEVAGAKWRYNQQVRVADGEHRGLLGWIVGIEPRHGAEPLYTVELLDGDPCAEIAESSLESVT
jgi:hypothetical protein